jgi:hypothetical protein
VKALSFTYRRASVDTLPCVAGIPEERGERNEKVEVVGQQLVEVPCTLDPRSRDDLPVLIRGVLKQFVLV